MNPITQLTDVGVSVWLDDLGRDRLTSGELPGWSPAGSVASRPTLRSSLPPFPTEMPTLKSWPGWPESPRPRHCTR